MSPTAAIEALLEGLNEPQREAVIHVDGPLLVLAGAGSGKTRVLTHRIAFMVGTERATAGEILAITFTNKAAAEMRGRVETLVGPRVKAMWVMTFHSACARMLRAEGTKLGYTRGFTIYDASDAQRLVKHCIDELDVDPKRFTPRAIANQISDAKNGLLDAAAYRDKVSTFFEQTAADVYEMYEKRIHANNAMDFDDLLFRCVELLEVFPEVRGKYANGFQQVLVDEYQDTNRAQYRWLQLLASEHQNLTVVGDDAQCLVEGTMVTMGDGSRRAIETIRPGDEVLSCYGSGDYRPARVTDTYESTPRRGVEITLRSGRAIVSTPEHTHFAGEGCSDGDYRRESSPQLGVTLCAQPGLRTAVHSIQMGREKKSFTDYGEAMSTATQLGLRVAADVRQQARLGADGGSLAYTPASSVEPGMAMFAEDGSYDTVETVRFIELDKPVYDINVEGTHNFVANGIVTHNSIYGWRGADIRNILDFEKDFPDARVIKLEQNYRSTQTILDAANAVIKYNRGGLEKHLWTDEDQGDKIKVRQFEGDREEASWVAAEIQRLVDEGTSRDEMAVFYRTNAMSRLLQDILVSYDVDYQVIGGTKFYDRAEIKDAVAYLNLLVNPNDVLAFQRAVNSPRRGIGNTTQARIVAYANTMGEAVFDIALVPEDVPGLGAAAHKAVNRFMSTMQRLRERVEAGAKVGDLIQEMLTESGYMDALRAERTIEAQGRIENLEELVGIGREFDQSFGEEASLEAFLERISLLADTDNLSDDEGVLTLMTLHNAKGLEYPIVFILGMEEGVFPHMRAIDSGDVEEERRLAYVGITRAMRELYLTFAESRMTNGNFMTNVKSRFLDELPEELCDIVVSERRQSWSSWNRGSQQSSFGGGSGGRFRGAGEYNRAAAPARKQPEPGKSFSLGDDVEHAAFGEGVVIGIEPGGLVVVRFAGDGSEKKLMADYAPLTKK